MAGTNSTFLDSYGAFVVPLLFTAGYALIETFIAKKKVSYIGIMLVTLGWIIFWERAEAAEGKDENLVWGILLTMAASAFVLFCELTHRDSYMLVASAFFALSWTLLVWVLAESDASEEKTQYIILSALLIVSSIVYFIPRQRKQANLYDMGLPLFAIGWTLLAICVIESPANDLILVF